MGRAGYRRRARLGRWAALGGARLRRRRGARRGRGSRRCLQVVRSDVAENWNVLAEPEDEGNCAGGVELRLEKAGVKLLELMDASDGLDVRCIVFRRRRLQRVEVI